MQKISLLKQSSVLLIATTFLSFLFFLWGVNSWKFSFAGDEWSFYSFAFELVKNPYFYNPFSFAGVYGTHSILASMYQAFFMELFGTTNFAWRLSNIILIFPISFFFYHWIKKTFNKNIAILATILLQCSFSLANFFKIGYDNPQSFVLFIICLYLAALFGKKPTRATGLWLGATLGVSFYIYFGPAFPLFIWPYFLPLRKSLHKPEVKKALILLISSYLLTLSPLLFQLHSLTRVFKAMGSASTFHIKSTVFYDFLLYYHNHDYIYNHFVIGPYLDVITQVLCIIGTGIVIFTFRKNSSFIFLLSYISTVIFIGATSSDWFSPITRGIFLLPYGFVFAGLGLNMLRESISGKIASFVICSIIILLAATLNVYQSQVGVFSDPDEVRTGISLILRSMQQAQTTKKHIIILLSPGLNINLYTWVLPYMIQAYGLSNVRYTILNQTPLFCTSDMANSTILIFQYDHYAQQQIKRFGYDTHVTYSLLSPSTNVY